MIFYKIRHNETGLYLNGKVALKSWNKNGKVWVTLGKLRFFITAAAEDRDAFSDFDHWEVVEFEVIEKSTQPIMAAVDPKKIIKLLKNK